MTLTTGESTRPAVQSILPIAALSALGIVFGDIGTSPLMGHQNPSRQVPCHKRLNQKNPTPHRNDLIGPISG